MSCQNCPESRNYKRHENLAKRIAEHEKKPYVVYKNGAKYNFVSKEYAERHKIEYIWSTDAKKTT